MYKKETSTQLVPRKHPRLQPPEGTIAALRPHGEKIGVVRDIGKGGLCFYYLVPNYRDRTPGEHEGTIDIYWPDQKKYIPAIKCTIIWEKEELNNNEYSNGTPAFNRVGVRFDDSTPAKQSLIDDFLARCYSVKTQSHLSN